MRLGIVRIRRRLWESEAQFIDWEIQDLQNRIRELQEKRDLILSGHRFRGLTSESRATP